MPNDVCAYHVPESLADANAEKERYLLIVDAYFAKIYNAQGYVDYEIGRTFETSIIAHEIIDEWYTNALLYRSPENRRDAAVEYFANFSGPNEIYSQLQDLFDLCDECRQ